MKTVLNIIIGFVIISGLFVSTVHAETLGGVVVRPNNTPVPGLTVSLVNPAVGRSYPSISDPYGRFFFSNVPLVNSSFYIEIYWGYQLLYRNTVTIRGNMQLPPIVLP